MILDYSLTKTVCGEEWLKCYVDSLREEERHDIKSFKSNTELKFEDEKFVT